MNNNNNKIILDGCIEQYKTENQLESVSVIPP